MKRIVALLFVCALIVAVASAQGEKFTLKQVLSSPFPSDLIASAKGSRVAWVFNAQGKRNIWVAEGPKFAARQLTTYNADDGQEITDVDLTSTGGTIVFVRGGDKNQAGDVPNPSNNPDGVEQAIWAVSWAGGAPRKIDLGTSPTVSPARPDATALVAYVKPDKKVAPQIKIWLAPLAGAGKPIMIEERGQNSSPTWSPDGKKLAFVSNRGTHSLIVIYDTAKKTISFVAPSVDRDSVPRWSPDGRMMAFIRTPARATDARQPGFWAGPELAIPWSIFVADLATGSAKQIWQSADNVESNIPRMAGPLLLNWGAEGRIVFASEMDGWLRLYSIPSNAEDAKPVALTPEKCEFEQATFTPDLRSIVFASNCTDIDRRHLSRVPVAGGAAEQLTSGESIEWAPVVTGDGKSIAYLASDARVPAMPFVRSATATGKGEMIARSTLPKDFPSDKLVVPQQVIIESADGVKCHDQLFLPAEIKPGEKRPAVIFMHGGPMRQMMLGWHNRGYYHQAYAVNQYFASRGYVVLSVNYRSGIMYGRAFREAKNRGARGATEYQDIVAAGKYLAARKDVDPKRIGLWGGSYGGYLTALGLARDSDLFAAGVDLHGVHDWSQRDIIQATALSGDVAKTAREASPVAAVEKWKSPVLLIQGDDDRNVAFGQMVDLVARLRKQGVYFEQMVFPDEVHDFLRHDNWLQIYTAAFNFFERKMTGARAATESERPEKSAQPN